MRSLTKLTLLIILLTIVLTYTPTRFIIIENLEIPKSEEDKITRHFAFSLSYNTEHKQANWIAYELTRAETKKVSTRAYNFQPDPKINPDITFDDDYAASGYDRGHLAPAADMAWSFTAMKESFYYSNISPQDPSFNRGIWRRLESLVRKWAIENGAIDIVSGPVLDQGLPTLGDKRISIPKYFYKVILVYRPPLTKGIGFIIPSMDSPSQLQDFAVSIDSVEILTGLDFFPLLPNDEEAIIERSINIVAWIWQNSTIDTNKE